jgi:uncharacterized protein YdaT
MAYTTKKLPPEIRELHPKVQERALEQFNHLIKQNLFPESAAISISVKSAMQWYNKQQQVV